MIHDESSIAGVHVLAVEDRIDLVCDEFEDRWRQGPPPAIEDFLHRCPNEERSALFGELLLVDIEQRRARQDPPTFGEYAARFPSFSQELQSVWSQLGVQETVVLASTDTPVDRFSAGMRIAQFELLEKLGTGGAGEVWKAHDTSLQRTVAVKVPRQQQLSDDDLQRFLREGQAAAQLRHCNLVSVHEAGHDGTVAFLVSDFIDGENLRTWLAHRRPTPRECAQLTADVAEALHHAHEHGVIHRDLKPANVLMDKSGRPHVTDFGLAKWADDGREMTVDGQILGTPAYMSPEQARGESQRVDRRTDVYALGTLLYELLTGQRPFAGDQAAVMHHIIHSDPRRPRAIDRKIPRDLETICLKALEKDSARRYPSAQEMAVDLRRFLRGEPILARRVSPLERGARWIRRHPAIAASVVFALVTIGSLSVARMFAEENRQLLGLRTVTLTTEPVGARVTFVPLDKLTEEPLPDKMVHARTPSPVVEDLAPGDYLVVAVLPDGRFHEVFRHVPDKEDNLPGIHRHLGWTARDGMVELPKISIPNHSVTDNMVFIQGADSSTAIHVNLPRGDNPVTSVPSFYVDCGEATVRDYRRIYGQAPPDLEWSKVPDDYAVTLYYDWAVAMAEKMGKRLPMVEEYEHVARDGSKSDWPWGNEPPPKDSTTKFGPVGSPDFDRLLQDPRVTGLCSNVAEWTNSSTAAWRHEAAVRSQGSKPMEPLMLGARFKSTRWIVGGDEVVIKGNATVAAEHRTPTVHSSVSIGTLHPGLGFRCVRSARPRDVPEAFSPVP